MMGVWGTKGRPKPLLVAYEMVEMGVLMGLRAKRCVSGVAVEYDERVDQSH